MAKVSYDLAAMTAAFTARGGKVETVATGKRAIESDRTIYAAMREGVKATSDAVRENRESYCRHETMIGAFHAARAEGWSTAASHDYAEGAAD